MAMSEEHAELGRMIETLQATLDHHIQVDHAGLLQRAEVEDMVSGVASETEEKLDDVTHQVERVNVRIEAVTLRVEDTAAKVNETAIKVGHLVSMWKGPIDPLTGEHDFEEGLEFKFNQALEKLAALGDVGGLRKSESLAVWGTLLGSIVTTIGVIVVAYFQFG